MSEQPAGPIVDNLGVVFDLEPHQQVTELLVIAKAVDFQTEVVYLLTPASRGLDWIAQRGLLAAAKQIMNEAADHED